MLPADVVVVVAVVVVEEGDLFAQPPPWCLPDQIPGVHAENRPMSHVGKCISKLDKSNWHSYSACMVHIQMTHH